jgi:hypothetical protein
VFRFLRETPHNAFETWGKERKRKKKKLVAVVFAKVGVPFTSL